MLDFYNVAVIRPHYHMALKATSKHWNYPKSDIIWHNLFAGTGLSQTDNWVTTWIVSELTLKVMIEKLQTFIHFAKCWAVLAKVILLEKSKESCLKSSYNYFPCLSLLQNIRCQGYQHSWELDLWHCNAPAQCLASHCRRHIKIWLGLGEPNQSQIQFGVQPFFGFNRLEKCVYHKCECRYKMAPESSNLFKASASWLRSW